MWSCSFAFCARIHRDMNAHNKWTHVQENTKIPSSTKTAWSIWCVLFKCARTHTHTHAHRASNVCFQCSYLFVIVYTNKQASTSYLKKITFAQYILWIDRKRECTIWFVCNVNTCIKRHYFCSFWNGIVLRSANSKLINSPSSQHSLRTIQHSAYKQRIQCLFVIIYTENSSIVNVAQTKRAER